MAAFLCSLERVLSQTAVEGGAMHVVGVLDGTKRGQVGVSLAAGLRPCASDRLGADVSAASGVVVGGGGELDSASRLHASCPSRAHYGLLLCWAWLRLDLRWAGLALILRRAGLALSCRGLHWWRHAWFRALESGLALSWICAEFATSCWLSRAALVVAPRMASGLGV